MNDMRDIPIAYNHKQKVRNQKRILMFLSNAFDPDPRVFQEAKALVENGHKVTLICWDRDYKTPAYEIIDGIKVERIYIRSTHGRGSLQSFFLLLFWINALQKIIFRDFDLIYCHDFDTLPLGFLLGLLRKKKVIYDSHESYADMLAGNVHPIIKKIIIFIENFIIKRISLLITVGEILKEEFVRRGAKRAVVVGNWKSLRDFNIPKETIHAKREELQIPHGRLVLSFISHLHEERKVPEIIEAIRQDKDAYLIIGGKGSLAKMVEEEAQQHKNIIYLGFVNMKDVPLYTCVSDAIFYGFASDNPNAQYSAPNKLFEALVAGKAIITGDFGEIGHIVKKYQCGVILKDYSVKTLQSAFMFLKDSKNLNQCQKNSLNLAMSQYNWEKGKEILIREIKKLS